MGMACAAWAIATPVGSSPDDDAHLGSGWAALTNQDLRGPSLVVPKSFVLQAECMHRPPPDRSIGVCADQATTTGTSELVTVPNRTPNYPQVFHRFLGCFFGEDLSRSIYMMRLGVAGVGVVLMAVPLVLVAISRRDIGMSTLPLALVLGPLTWFFLASTSPSAWELAGAICSWGSLIALALASSRRDKVWAVGGIAVGLLAAAVSRPAGGILTAAGIGLALPIIIIRWVEPQARHRTWQKFAIGYSSAAALVVILAVRGSLDINWGPGIGRYPITAALAFHNFLASPQFVINQLGPVGWLHAGTGPWAELAFLTITGYVVMSAYRAGSRALTLVLTLSLTATLLAAGTLLTLSHTAAPVAFQARYFWGLAVGPVYVAVIGLGLSNRLREVFNGHVRWVSVVALSLGSATALTLVVRYFSAQVARGAGFPAIYTWQPPVLGTVGCIAVGSVAMGLVYALSILRWPVPSSAETAR